MPEVESDQEQEVETDEEVVDPVEVLETKVAELEDLRLRDLAEFENIKKRLEKEKTQSIAYAQESFARDLLSVIDSLDSANSSMDEQSEASIEKIKEGIDLTLEQFKKTFEKHGIELVTMDTGFDPNFHEAVMRVDSEEHETGAIVQVFQKGYKIKERVLRPAMVSIAN
ncbi:MAG: nucleotide exchange factor GrpE [Epsilonproteobacteria bacterium]|nr:nucleotide exchange factor GrpE [Campylobacterota bacterium]